MEATTQVLLNEGYDKFTTARAAERAGVSVGSLYQYFPNKAALAYAVIDRCCDEFLVAFEAALSRRRRTTLADCVRAIIEVTLVSHHLTPELHRMVIVLAPRLGVADRTAMVSRRAAALIESMLRSHSGEIAPEVDLPAAAVVIEALLETLAHRVMLAQVTQAQNDAIAQEATRLVTRYLAAAG